MISYSTSRRDARWSRAHFASIAARGISRAPAAASAFLAPARSSPHALIPMRAGFWCAAALLVLVAPAAAAAESDDATPASDLFPTAEKVAADKKETENEKHKMAYGYTPGAISRWFYRIHKDKFIAELDEFYADAKGKGNYTEQMEKVGAKFYPKRVAALWAGLIKKYPKTRRARLRAVLDNCKPRRDNAFCQTPLDRTTQQFDAASEGGATQYQWVGDTETGRHATEPFVPRKRVIECNDLLKAGNSFFEDLLKKQDYDKADKDVAFANAMNSYRACLEKDADFSYCALAIAQATMDPAWHPAKQPSWHEVNDVVVLLHHALELTAGSKPIRTHRMLADALEMRGDHDLACQQVAKVFQLMPTSHEDFHKMQEKMDACKQGLKAMHDEI